ncbi:volume-regulated anion channel subunit LRRC8E [Gadus morhua]|uniref:volume-regulated anion channel subunit LRRC8E n=1 Tax=Gadus morhua TaxID=8049 RepID=UPI0011B77A35|nr:volume-regulated anion channel subunit LRRC8E-like [Gadus morhua]
MFALSELTCLHEPSSGSKLLKPWWEVFMDCLVVLMLMLSVLAGTVLLSRDKVVCLPVVDAAATAASSTDTRTNHSSPAGGGVPVEINPSGETSARPAKRKPLVYQQYVFISQVCYHQALPWYSRFSPYMALLQTLLLLASGSFWLHLPLTSARVEHFLAVLAKCVESPWTTRSLSHAALHETTAKPPEGAGFRDHKAPPPGTPTPPHARHRYSVDSGTDSPSLGRATAPLGPVPPSVAPPPGPRGVAPAAGAGERAGQGGVSLDRSDSEQARALFERVRKFRAHCESSDVIYKVYVSQTLFKLLASGLIVGLSAPLLGSMAFTHVCHPGKEGELLGYSTFQCAHTLASLLHKLLLAYLLLLASYGLLNLYALGWIAHSSLRQYSFSVPRDPIPLGDVPDLTNDLAFLLHMADQYDPLLAQRLSVFLSPVSETRLLEENLERRWGPEELRALVVEDPEGGPGLTLGALPRLPPALYTLGHLRTLRLERVAHARLGAQVAAMASLRELHLDHCPLALEPGALAFLQEHLEVLQLSFSAASELPAWVYSLRSLHQLHLSGPLGCEGPGGRGWALGSLRPLRRLRVLVLRGALQRIPAELAEVAGGLARLELHNGGLRLLPSGGLKRLAGLAELRLRDCRLDRLPGGLAALPRLRTLDLGHNDLRSLEEPPGLGPLRALTGLTLDHNRLLLLPPGVGALRGLELLDLAFNQLQSLPPALFTLPSLRRLLLGGNLLRALPPAVGELRRLAELDLSENRLEQLPAELFCCSELRVLGAAHNALGALPPAVGRLGLLCRLDLRGNPLEDLPPELATCPGLRGSGGGAGGLVVEDRLLRTLPCWARDLLVQTPAPPSGPPSRPGSGIFPPSRPGSGTFPRFSTNQWNFHSALESRI